MHYFTILHVFLAKRSAVFKILQDPGKTLIMPIVKYCNK